MPILKIKNKQTNGEILKLLILKVTNEKTLQSKKKMKERMKFIFFDLLFIFKLN